MTELKISLEVGECNGYMDVNIYVNNELVSQPDLTKNNNSTVDVDLQVNFPFDLKIQVSGKNLNTDTQIDDGKIVKDKYIKLKKLYLARYSVHESVLYSTCSFYPENKSREQNNYFYCNGVAELKFQEPDALVWHVKHNKYWS